MTVATRSSAGGTSAQSSSTKPGPSGAPSKKSKKTHTSPKISNEISRSSRRSGKRNVLSTSSDQDGEDADDELHPTDCNPPPLKRRRKETRPAADHERSESNASNIRSNSIKQGGPGHGSPTTDGGRVPGNSGTNTQRLPPKRMPKRDKQPPGKSGTNTVSIAVRPHDVSGPATAMKPEQVDDLSSSLSELTTSDGSPLPLPALTLPLAAPDTDEQVSSVLQKEENSFLHASEPESVVPASQADSAPLASQESSIVPASVSGSSQVMDLSCTQDADAGEGDADGDGEHNLPLPQTTQTTTLGQQNGLTQEALESFSMEESLPHSAMDTQTSKGAADEDRLSYVTDENEGEHVPLTQEDPPSLTLPLFNDAGDWQPPVPDDGFLPPAPVMKDLDVFSQSQPYSSQGGTQRDFPSSSQMSIVSSGGQVSPSRPPSFRYPLLAGSSLNDVSQRSVSKFESPFAQTLGTSRAVPNTKRNFALGADAIQFEDPGHVPSLAFPPPFPPPQSSGAFTMDHPIDAEGEHEVVLPDDQPYQQL